MKKTILFCLVLLSFNLIGQVTVKLSGNIFNANNDSVKISQIIGNRYVDYLKGQIDKKGNFVLEGKIPAPDYYVFRFGNQSLNIILRNKTDMKLYGDAKNFMQFHNVVNSDETIKLNEFVDQMRLYNFKKDSATQYLQRFPDQEKAVNESFSKVYYEFQTYKQAFVNENQESAALLPVLNELDIEKEYSTYEIIVKGLIKSFPESPSIQNVKMQYEQNKARKEAMNFLEPGKVAPDFSQAKVDGTSMKLSDLKGKVVLLDFWASWCGPCRQENPNVVKLYEKYKDAGFTVMSVSLDKDKASWMKAIEKDRLSWTNHVSDLKFWQNEAAQMYKVTGIPFTVLIDKEGKIINKNMRGADLENALKAIFGF